MSVLNIDKYLPGGSVKVRDRIYRIGVELEGGWEKLPPGVNIDADGSVNVQPVTVAVLQPDGTTKNVTKKLHTGEIPSEILERKKLETFIKTYYPTQTNQTCGLHVHMSFENAKHYMMLMVKDYQDTIVAYLGKWAKAQRLPDSHPIWPRLRGDSQYCRLDFWADHQAAATTKQYSRDRPGCRYTAINYCYNLHNTLECRILPMFATSEQANLAVQHVLDITNATLVYLRKREEKHQAKIEFDTKENGKTQVNEVISPEKYEELEEFYV